MCLIVRQDDLPRNIFQKIFGIKPKIKVLIAKKDIICYKVYKITDIPGVVEAPYQGTKHLIGKPQPKVKIIYNQNFWLEDEDEEIRIEEGYHSIVNNDIDLSHFYQPKKELIIKKCIIPKGSEYYIGNFGEIRNGYVSNQLIIL